MDEKERQEKLKQFILTSGFPLQLRVASIIKNSGYDAINSPLFFDNDEKITREIDVESCLYPQHPLPEEIRWSLNPFIIIECKKSEKYNWVFYDSSQVNFEFSVGNYMDFLMVNGTDGESLLEQLPFRDTLIRHCIDAKYVSGAYQQVRVDGHEVGKNEILDAVSKVIKYMNYQFERLKPFYSGIRDDIIFYYPTIVFEGNLYFASFKKTLNIRPVDHIVYETRYPSGLSGDLVPLYIDVVRHDAFKRFLNVIIKEIATFEQKMNDPAIQHKLDLLAQKKGERS